MAIYNDATSRQQEILQQLSSKIGGFAVGDITNITYDAGIPVGIDFTNESGSATRETVSALGGIINDIEHARLQEAREQRQTGSTVYDIGSGTTGNNQPTLSENILSNDTTNNSASTQYTGNTSKENRTRPLLGILNLVRGLSGTGGTGTSTRNSTVINRFPSAAQDQRVKIWDPSGRISRLGGALAPLRRTDYKVIFPYTPEINLTHNANYQQMNPTHSNYDYLFYQNSAVSEISINGIFTARNAEDADYVIAVQHFFRSITKMFYGNDDIAGLPPVVCRLEGHGHLQFSSVPIVITGFTTSLPSDVDYVSASVGVARVPTSQTLQITGKPLYSRNRLTNEFSLTKFASGNFLGNSDTGLGGGI